MLPAVQLQIVTRFRTIKIQNMLADLVLEAKFVSGKSSVTENHP